PTHHRVGKAMTGWTSRPPAGVVPNGRRRGQYGFIGCAIFLSAARRVFQQHFRSFSDYHRIQALSRVQCHKILMQCNNNCIQYAIGFI
ncbi:hypothetical protein, partial [Clostridium perfringens]